jgi:anti-anti-sigma factor
MIDTLRIQADELAQRHGGALMTTSMRPGELRLEDHADGSCHRLALAGELDLANAESLVSAAREICEAGASELLLDLEELAFMDSTGLRAIAECMTVARSHDCEFALTHPQQHVSRVFEIAGLQETFVFKNAP